VTPAQARWLALAISSPEWQGVLAEYRASLVERGMNGMSVETMWEIAHEWKGLQGFILWSRNSITEVSKGRV
jgi:hypothetical protein